MILIGGILLCLSCEKVMAQMPYKSSVGGVISSAMGVSFKTFLADHVVLQTDLLKKGVYGIGYEKGVGINYMNYSSLEQNTNVMYQKKIKEIKKSDLFWFAGGGVSIGYVFAMKHTCGKIGANAIVGLEFVFKKKPLSIQMDLRPGYGYLFYDISYSDPINIMPVLGGRFDWHHFDWMAGFTLRYTFKGKKLEE